MCWFFHKWSAWSSVVRNGDDPYQVRHCLHCRLGVRRYLNGK